MIKKWLAWLLVLVFIVSGCQVKQKKPEAPVGKQVSLAKLTAEIKANYQADTLFTGDKLTVARDEGIPLELGFDFNKLGFKKFTEVAAVYVDKELQYSVDATYDRTHEKEGKPLKTLTVLPPRRAAGAISSMESQRGDLGYQMGEKILFAQKDQEDWGNLGEYYLAVYVDLKTGEKLAKPVVTPFSVKHELQTDIRLTVEINELGLPVFNWNKVKGAKEYYLVKSDFRDTETYKMYGENMIVARTSKTNWQPRQSQASEFKTHSDSFGKVEKISKNARFVYSVIAVSEKGTSAMSNTLSADDLAKRVPQSQQPNLDEEGVEQSFEEIRKSRIAEDGSRLTALLPSYRWIVYGDGNKAQRLITYHIDQAYQDELLLIGLTEDGKEDSGIETALVVPYSIDGTYFDDHYFISLDEQVTDWQTELKEVEERQTNLRNKAGTTELAIIPSNQQDKLSELAEKNKEIAEVVDSITANSALSEYLASNMLAGETVIDLSDYPDAQSKESLYDAWMEAVYQNPLILGAKSAQIISKGNGLRISYDFSQAEMQQKQVDIRREVKKVIGMIIEDDMSELEKELAINKYLMEAATYDDQALANAEKNQFKTVDKVYADSFTPYGVLLNKVGVCASYAGAFKLLGDAAGLETIVVTGNLNGEIPHAWNRVKINGQWHSVDSTNNGNDVIKNPLFNVPKKVAETVLIEDDRYIQNDFLNQYLETNEQEKNEYYHSKDKFFDPERIVSELVAEIDAKGSATYRTKYDLSSTEFNSIQEKVANQHKGNNLTGYYWLGVIHIVEEK